MHERQRAVLQGQMQNRQEKSQYLETRWEKAPLCQKSLYTQQLSPNFLMQFFPSSIFLISSLAAHGVGITAFHHQPINLAFMRPFSP